MEPICASAESTVLAVVDVQPSLLPEIQRGEEVVRRAQFLCRAAGLLGLPIIATEQNPGRLGATVPELRAHLPQVPLAKMTFSCGGSPAFMKDLEDLAPKQVVLVGIETHICMLQTALDLLRIGKQVFVVGDAVGARSAERHEMGLRRIEAAGAVIVHGESIVYEWLGTAEHPRFRDVLALVKEYS